MIKLALWILSRAMRNDADYARSWHANLSMMAQDAGADRKQANERACDFMNNAFGVRIYR